jgi:hypothetical protein
MAKRTTDQARASTELARSAAEQLTKSDQQLQVTRDALNATVLPLLVDVPPTPDQIAEFVEFGSPVDTTFRMIASQVFKTEQPHHLFSIPLRNIGVGIAVLTRVWTEPAMPVEIDFTNRTVEPTDRVRVNLTAPESIDEDPAAMEHWNGSFLLAVEYSDALGAQTLVTRALVGTHATSGTQVRGFSISRDGLDEPFISSGHHDQTWRGAG